MRLFRKSIFTFLLSASLLTLNAQQNAELGVRITQAPYNKIQLEFRKPLNEKYAFRSGLSVGQDFVPTGDAIFDANDSLVTMRHKDGLSNYYDIRFGLNRVLKNSPFSLHLDFVFGYNRNYLRNWNYSQAADSAGNWDYSNIITFSSQAPLEGSTSDAYNHFLSGGFSFGASFDYPLGERFVLSLNLNQTFMARFQFRHTERNDIYNEFHEGNSTLLEFYSTAGIGLRYRFGVKQD